MPPKKGKKEKSPTVLPTIMSTLPELMRTLQKESNATQQHLAQEDMQDPPARWPLDKISELVEGVKKVGEALEVEDALFTAKAELGNPSKKVLESTLSDTHESSRKLAIVLTGGLNQFCGGSKSSNVEYLCS